jgi:hypothetical protein
MDSADSGHTALVRSGSSWIGATALALALSMQPGTARADEFGSAVYVRSDSDHTTVISPRVRAKADLQPGTNLEVVYGVDVWTSASIDIRAAASHVVSEQRDEIDANVTHDMDDVTIGAGYRWSKENDYLSNSGSASVAYNFADNAATLALSAYVSADSVGRSGDPSFDKGLTSIGSRLGFTQVIDPSTVLQLSYDLAYLDGYQASPYRYVPIGGGVSCATLAPMCVPERDPGTRLRHALVARIRRALGSVVSVGLGYRFYRDDWSVQSHTLEAQLGWLVGEDSQLGLRYRFYVQSAAEFYHAQYPLMPAPEFVTIDRELSPLGIHRIGAEYEQGFHLDTNTLLKGVLALGVNFYHYDDFPGLDNVRALELSVAGVLVL